MKVFDVAKFAAGHGLAWAIATIGKMNPNGIIEKGAIDSGANSHFTDLQTTTREHGFIITDSALKGLYHYLVEGLAGKQPMRGAQLGGSAEQVIRSIREDLMGRKVFILSYADSLLLEAKHEQIVVAFFATAPQIIADVREASACLVFERYTATVFHLMRAMEAAVNQIVVALNVTTKAKMWGPKLNDIDKVIADMPDSDSKSRWRSVSAYLHAVKNAWRNPTMHGDVTYGRDEAISIHRAVIDFLPRIG